MQLGGVHPGEDQAVDHLADQVMLLAEQLDRVPDDSSSPAAPGPRGHGWVSLMSAAPPETAKHRDGRRFVVEELRRARFRHPGPGRPLWPVSMTQGLATTEKPSTSAVCLASLRTGLSLGRSGY